MDIYPRSAAAAQAINLYNAKCTLVCAIDKGHRCSDECEYFLCDRLRVAVCKSSRHTHVCTRDCSLAVAEQDGMYCKVTAYQVGGPSEHAHVNATKFAFGRRFSNMHWAPPAQKAAKKKPSNQHAKRVRSMLQSLFLSKERKDILGQAESKCRAKMREQLQKGTVAAYFSAVEHRRKMANSLRPLPESIPEPFIRYIIEQTERIRGECVRRRIPCKRTDASLVLGLLQLLKSGFSACGATMISQSQFVKNHALSEQQYGLLPGVRCRSQTISTRLVKKALLTTDGEPLFLLPPPPV